MKVKSFQAQTMELLDEQINIFLGKDKLIHDVKLIHDAETDEVRPYFYAMLIYRIVPISPEMPQWARRQ